MSVVTKGINLRIENLVNFLVETLKNFEEQTQKRHILYRYLTSTLVLSKLSLKCDDNMC